MNAPASYPKLLKLLSVYRNIMLEEMSGEKTLAGAREIFTAGIELEPSRVDPLLRRTPSKKVFAQVYEVVENATFFQLFSSLAGDKRAVSFTEGQIVQFCTKYANMLDGDGYGTFFLFGHENEFQVAVVRRKLKGLSVITHPFSYGYVWVGRCGHRLIVPKINFRV